MNTKGFALIILCCLPVLMLSSPAVSDDQERMMVKVPHEFTVGEQSLPAGRYSVSCSPGEPSELHLHDTAGSTCARLPVLTRLAPHSHGESAARMVFDRVGGITFLSEVWLDGEDGYLVLGTPKEHTHEIVYFGS